MPPPPNLPDDVKMKIPTIAVADSEDVIGELEVDVVHGVLRLVRPGSLQPTQWCTYILIHRYRYP